MKILSYAVGDQESFGLLVEDGVLDLATRLGVPTLRAALAADILHQAAEFAGSTADHPLERIKFLPVVPDTAHSWCRAINYQDHTEEIQANGIKRETPKQQARRTEEQRIGQEGVSRCRTR